MQIDTLIIGAGAAGLMCAAHLGGHVVIVDHAKRPGEKIRISGGGRCNFTNLYSAPDTFISSNPHFVKSALARYTQWDFIDLVGRYSIAWHEKTLGQLFCNGSSQKIIDMLLREAGHANLRLATGVQSLRRLASGFQAKLSSGDTLRTRQVVIATGGKSIPKMGATGFAYDIARQFELPVRETRAGLVPFAFPDGRFSGLSGIAIPVRALAQGPAFDEALLFTHRGLSGPAMLQISSYWSDGAPITINLLPDQAGFHALRTLRQNTPRKSPGSALAHLFPARLAQHLASQLDLSGNMADQTDRSLMQASQLLQNWQVTPQGTEGFRTAEVTVGGVDTSALSSKTMEAHAVPGLYFIGECMDVTGWLGGYNFQWAWSSAVAAARAITAS